MTEIFPIPTKEVYKLIRHAVGKFNATRQTNAEYDDLVQNAMIRLIEVLDKYDKDKGKFSTFVYMQVKWAIWRQKIHERGRGRKNFIKSVSLDKVRGDNEDTTLLDTLVNEEKTDDGWKLEILMENLTPYEWFLLTEWLLNKKSGRIIGLEHNVPEGTMQNRLKRLKKKARKIIDENIIR